jgi:7,8-dihydropterin-6-yl-methyl-4-(beta-D-ribofuranosyl)aminobenzene 5'-phosphate synthase
MAMAVRLLEADALQITTIVDNQIDALLPGDEAVQRRPWGVTGVHNPYIEAVTVANPLRAEHGFSALVTVTRGSERHTLLFDLGVSTHGAIENMDRLEIAPKDVEGVVLSHGHFDHTGGLEGLVERLGRVQMPLILHPEAYSKRRAAPPGREPSPLPPPSRAAMEGAGFELVEARDPSVVFADTVLVTGEVERTTQFEQGFPFFEREVDGRWEPEPHLLDDQALVVNLKDRGLVVLSGCGHAGIVNVVKHAQATTGVQRIHGIAGGFHLSGTYFEPQIGPTVEALRAFGPAIVVPAHCTGYKPQMALAAAMPGAYVHNAVGTTVTF